MARQKPLCLCLTKPSHVGAVGVKVGALARSLPPPSFIKLTQVLPQDLVKPHRRHPRFDDIGHPQRPTRRSTFRHGIQRRSRAHELRTGKASSIRSTNSTPCHLATMDSKKEGDMMATHYHNGDAADAPPSLPIENDDFEYDAEEEKRVLRKVDMRLIPAVFFMYLLSYLDRSKWVCNRVQKTRHSC